MHNIILYDNIIVIDTFPFILINAKYDGYPNETDNK